MHFDATWHMSAAMAALLPLLWLLRRRWARLAPMRSRSMAWFWLGGTAFFALALGQPWIMLWRPVKVEVWVDCSASTRTAGWRYRAELQSRIDTLLNGRDAAVHFFANGKIFPAAGAYLADAPGTLTRWPGAADSLTDAVLLFSDGQFHFPAQSPAIFAVADKALEQGAGDARVAGMRQQGERGMVQVINHGPPRRLAMTDQTEVAISTGTQSLAFEARAGGKPITARLAAGDAWPENDAMSLPINPQLWRRWWVGPNAPAGFEAIAPDQLPEDAGKYLEAAVVALPAPWRLSQAQMAALDQYVRQLGGSLLLMGGLQTFDSPAGWEPVLQHLSPLSVQPPRPVMHWIVLLDTSGSMAQSVRGQASAWQAAAQAAGKAVQALPANDRVSVVSFSNQTQWLALQEPASQAAGQWVAMIAQAPPPGGPTNLQAAVEQAAQRFGELSPKRLLVLSDAQAQLDDGPKLAKQLINSKITLDLLLLGAGGASAQGWQKVVEATGGQSISQIDPDQWSAAALQLLARGRGPALDFTAATIHFADELALPPRTVALRNRLWIKSDAKPLAWAGPKNQPVAALWRIEAGIVAASAMTLNDVEASRIAGQIAQRPRDPRLKVTWQMGGFSDQQQAVSGSVRVVAAENQRPLNDLKLSVRFSQPLAALPLKQTAPGEYEASLPYLDAGGPALLLEGDMVRDRVMFPSDYPPEFAAIGFSGPDLARWTRQSGGRIVTADEKSALKLPDGQRRFNLQPALIAAGICCWATALWRWRRS